jgi:hypothetical protein
LLHEVNGIVVMKCEESKVSKHGDVEQGVSSGLMFDDLRTIPDGPPLDEASSFV